MKILVAGTTGAIGRPLIERLLVDGHTVFGMALSSEDARIVADMGAESVIADALDPIAVKEAVATVRPEAIINQLTSLPKHYTPEAMNVAAERDHKVRTQGNASLLAAGRAYGVRRYLLQSSAFWYAPEPGLANETASFAFDGSPGVSAGAHGYANLEASMFGQQDMECVALRYGFFYGADTWYSKEGDVGEQARHQQVPVIGDGQGVWSFVSVQDAAIATVAALHCVPGVYNIVDSEPSEQHVWLPAFARWAGAPDPLRLTEEQALPVMGADTVYQATQLRGASNEKARRELGFQPQPLEWLTA